MSVAAPVRIAVNGATGRMGRNVLELVREDSRFEVVAAITAPGEPQLGAPAFADGSGPPLRGDWTGLPRPDVVIDFSGPGGLAAALDHCLAEGVALVTGTTGLEAALQRRVTDAGERIAVLQASNFSLGVAVLTRLLRQAAAALPDWDLEIVEAHHGRKLDAPSGTALSLGQAAAAARGVALEEVARAGDRGGPREAGSIGFAVVRGGDIVGEHVAWLVGAGERVELGHRATDRSIFARGAIEAAHWLSGQGPGRYTLEHVLAGRLGAPA